MSERKKERSLINRSRYAALILIVGGAGAIAVAMSADLIGIGDNKNFGIMQITLSLVGLIALLSGIGLATLAGQRCLRKQRSKKRMNLLLLLASFALSFIGGELALRWDGRFAPPSYPPRCSESPQWCGLYQEFKPHGYRLWPSRISSYLYPPYNPRNLSVVSNRYGFRSSREFDQVDTRMRILVLGDSFVFGEGVEESERFTDVLEELQPLWRVDNMGMTGYGPDLMLRVLEEVGVRLMPDLVVFSIYTDDFRRVIPHYAGMGFEIPRFRLESGQLISVPYPKQKFWDCLYIFQVMNRLYWEKAQWALHEAILDRFVKLSTFHSFIPIIIFLPANGDATIDKHRRTWLEEYSQEHSVPYLDLSAPIHNAGQQAFINDNPHYNPYGHRIVAQELFFFLSAKVLGD